jgi:small neutral amino acid transporter SnatA (MarC family)
MTTPEDSQRSYAAKVERQRYAPPAFGSLSLIAAVLAGIGAANHEWGGFALALGGSIVLFLVAWAMTSGPSEKEIEDERRKIDKRIARLQARRP